MMRKLPFKIRSANPEIVHVTSGANVPDAVKNDRQGAVALYYKGKIYTFRKNLPKHVIEHEKAHAQITDDKTKTPTGSTAWLNNEIAADILTYKRTGKPEHIKDYIWSRLKELGYYHSMDDIFARKFNRYQVNSHAVAHLLKAYYKYYDFLPEAWQNDVDKFQREAERLLASMRKRGYHQRPGGDYFIKHRHRDGSFDVNYRRVIRKRDDITGLFVSRPQAGLAIVR
jgi:hypothetical protein